MKESGDLTGPPAGYDGHEIEIVAWMEVEVRRSSLKVCHVIFPSAVLLRPLGEEPLFLPGS